MFRRFKEQRLVGCSRGAPFSRLRVVVWVLVIVVDAFQVAPPACTAFDYSLGYPALWCWFLACIWQGPLAYPNSEKRELLYCLHAGKLGPPVPNEASCVARLSTSTTVGDSTCPPLSYLLCSPPPHVLLCVAIFFFWLAAASRACPPGRGSTSSDGAESRPRWATPP